MINRRTLAALAAAAALAALWPSSTFAADQHFPPTVGAPNCHGNVLGFGNSHGHVIAHVAASAGVSVQQIQISIREKCEAP